MAESQQYFYPGYHPEQLQPPRDIQTLLSTRTFLKVLQEFDALPHGEAIEKLYEFCETALNGYAVSVERLLERERRKREGQTPDPLGDFTEFNRMLCASLLLAARMGEHELLVRQIDEMQSHWNAYYDEIIDYVEPTFVDMFEQSRREKLYGPLEDDAVLTVFMHALEWSGEGVSALEDLNLSVRARSQHGDEGVLRGEGIPLFHWDAPLTFYDFASQRHGQTPDLNDAVELFSVYEFQSHDFDKQKKETVLQTLKEKLSK